MFVVVIVVLPESMPEAVTFACMVGTTTTIGISKITNSNKKSFLS